MDLMIPFPTHLGKMKYEISEALENAGIGLWGVKHSEA